MHDSSALSEGHPHQFIQDTQLHRTIFISQTTTLTTNAQFTS